LIYEDCISRRIPHGNRIQTLLTVNRGKKYLLDWGMFQGLGEETDDLNRDFGFFSSDIDYFILSHAHADHCGLNPKLVKEGFAGKVFATYATRDLSAILMADNSGIKENDLRFENKTRVMQGKRLLRPFYSL
jgi:metallo-beta-lactamase family protein